MSIETIKKESERILSRLHSEKSDVITKEKLESFKITFLGRNGEITALSGMLASIDKSLKPEAGRILNETKKEVASEIESLSNQIESASMSNTEFVDITLPGRAWKYGKKHPITQTIDDCVAIFRRIGFIVADGPCIETIHHCFDALNTPKDHPSREKSDTFYFPDGRLLRTQTSTVQIRVMESQEPPIRIIAPGPCFRPDTPDATHSANFYQIEGLYIDKNISMADLKSTLMYFARELMGENVQIRFRPHFFPFTEPSVEYDFSCIMCEGKGCNVCKRSGWLEMGGAGMVDPNVLRNVGCDPSIWSGFAWGMGVERIAMIRHRINDIRYFYDNDVRFLNQF
ncbi:MAG TPA: phenylalanine--tRNA ligase subunit alpha [Lentisphaeria bacterium]|nr:MAG: phenylalanine--tRNA ligase subunit alpha [Lentisphaerae bacterium GWF2_38_69]HBM14989.1 phenylalanine--tRNA ligase subunit alpha [Lentisphaeria bacterium]